MGPKNDPLLYRLEKFFGGLKFAVSVLLFFAFLLIIGTFVESWFGTDFANRLIYKSIPFMLVLGGLYLCIFMAALLRLPPKKKLYGFYTVHTALIIILIGSWITYAAGIDGNLTLMPGSPSRKIELKDDILKIRFMDTAKEYTVDLPYDATTTSLDIKIEELEIKKFLPFSEGQFKWTPRSNSNEFPYQHSSRYRIKNAFTAQEITLSLYPLSDLTEFSSIRQLGPLNIIYLPAPLKECFEKNFPHKLVVWDDRKGACFSPADINAQIKKTDRGNTFVAIPYEGGFLTFFPDFGFWPITAQFKLDQGSPLRVFSSKLFKPGPLLLVFGEKIGYLQGHKWIFKDFPKDNKLILPWMKMELTLLEHRVNEYPEREPVYTYPAFQGGKLIKGSQKAVEIVMGKGQHQERYWITDQRPQIVVAKGQKIALSIEKKTLSLPYELLLKQFKMDKDPGTNSPASYESFVTLFNGQSNTKHHVYMNNPLKYDGLTFYQASYFETEYGYASVLSVNYDPGRPIKYFGAILLVFGAIWHFRLRNAKPKSKKNTQAVFNEEVLI